MTNLVAALRSAVAEHPERTAIRFGRAHVGYRDLLSAACQLGHQLRAQGVAPGDRVAFAMPNSPRYAVALYGILCAGAVAVPLNPGQPRSALLARLRDASPRLFLVGHGPPPSLPDAAAAAGVPVVEAVDTAPGTPEIEPEPVPDDSPSVITYKSSDDDEPDGVVLSHHALSWSSTAAAAVLGLTGEDNLATHFPLFYPLGFTYGLGAAVAAGCGLTLPELGAEPAAVLADGPDAATVLSTYPMLADTMLADGSARPERGPGLRGVFCSGGRSLAPKVRTQLAERLGCDVLQGYGTVETSAIACAGRFGEQPPSGSMGRAVPGVELAVVDGRGREAETGKAGGLLARGPNVMTGYWERPRETELAFSSGWLFTGEKARQDAEGNVFLLDNVLWTDRMRGRETGRQGLLRRGLRKLGG